ncbi:MAG: hypothetical protein JWQ90_5450 [Hydrocarboniphaga sp.]|uniref:LysE family translocator n=1 Tax=Hydrocarboniphaga sp. TaxID=2033016 RepID=UPI002633CDCE|nr:LysE family translocator [Hydrocarboniphaga sp.]MDB5973000.1 hypothetical protein [Hydrocarboniphaga sp.]
MDATSLTMTSGAAALSAQLAALAFGTSITPGPNNLMLLSSGLRFGVRRTLPHCFGVSAGLALVLLLAYFGLGALLSRVPALQALLSITGALYLLWLAKVTASADPRKPLDAGSGAAAQPMSLGAAVAFQFINPKVWGMAASGVSLVLAADVSDVMRAPLLVGVYCLLNLPCISLWVVAGSGMRRHLAEPRLRRLFNCVNAALVAATALWMLKPVMTAILR